jgi:hypothetical protein
MRGMCQRSIAVGISLAILTGLDSTRLDSVKFLFSPSQLFSILIGLQRNPRRIQLDQPEVLGRYIK